MLPERVFKVADGYCHILLDKIVITNNEQPVSIDELKENTNISIKVIIYSIVIAILVAGTIVGFLNEDWYRGLFCLVFAVWFSLRIIRTNSYSTDTFVQRAAITKIEFMPAVYSIQKPHFIIHYKKEKELKKKWLLRLSNDYLKTDDEQIQKAIDIMDEEFG